jgi:hypothetical protein
MLQGKTPQETIDLVGRLVTGITELSRDRMQPTQPQYVTPQQQAQPLNPDLIIENPGEWQRQFAQALSNQQAQQMAAVAAPVLQQQAETARWMSQQDEKRKDIWGKYGTEVEGLMASIPAAYRTKAMWDKAADMVKAEHADEIIEERALQRAAQLRGTDTVGSGYGDSAEGRSGSAATEAWDAAAANPYGKHMIATVGKAGIAEHARREGLKLEDYLKTIGRSRTRLPGPGDEGVYWTELVED